MQQSFYVFATSLIVILFLVTLLTLIFFVIIEYIISKSQTDEYIEEKNKEKKIEDFYEKFAEVKNQTTKEILECLIEMEKLDEVYNQIKEEQIDFINELEYLEIKEKTLNYIIKEKIKDIELSKRKTENYKSLLDEIDVCRKRFPEYNATYIENENIINERIAKLKRN